MRLRPYLWIARGIQAVAILFFLFGGLNAVSVSIVLGSLGLLLEFQIRLLEEVRAQGLFLGEAVAQLTEALQRLKESKPEERTEEKKPTRKASRKERRTEEGVDEEGREINEEVHRG